VFTHVLMHYPAIATAALRKRSPLAAGLSISGRLLLRVYTKVQKAIRRGK